MIYELAHTRFMYEYQCLRNDPTWAPPDYDYFTFRPTPENIKKVAGFSDIL